jgi:hypothetical protein
MISVAEINSLDRLDSIRLLWRDLWLKTRRATFFQSMEWLESYIQHFGDEQFLRVLVVSLNGRHFGIVPFVVRNAESRLGNVRVLSYPLDDWGVFYGPVGPHPAATLSAALRHVKQTRRNWDLLDLRYIDADGVDHGRTRNAMRGCGFQAYTRSWRDSAVVQLEGNWSDYFGSRNAACREQYRHSEFELSQHGKVEFVRNRRELTGGAERAERWDLCEEFLQMHGREKTAVSRGGAWGAVARNGDCSKDFLSSAHAAAARAGAADVSLLYVDGKPVCAAYGYCSNGRVDGVALASAGDALPAAGTVLIGRMLRDSFDRGDESYVFPIRNTEFAAPWKTTVATSYRYTHFASVAAKAQALRLNHLAKRWIGNARRASSQSPTGTPGDSRAILPVSNC